MKKTFLLVLLATGTAEARAQSIAAGTISLGGSISYNQLSSNNNNTVYSGNSGLNYNFSNETKGHYFYLSPAASYFVADNLAVGLALGYSNGKRVEDAVSNPAFITVQHVRYTTTSLRAGAFGQYYKMLNTQFGLTGRLGAGYQWAKEDSDGYNAANGTTNYFVRTNTSAGYYADLTPGIIFFPIPKFGINASLGSFGFSHYRLTDSRYSDANGSNYSQGDKNENDNFTANFGLDAFQLGGMYYFGRK